MSRPGVEITIRETPPPRSAPTSTSGWFVVGLTERGQTTPQVVTSIADFESRFGGRVSYSLLYDALDEFFREGGSQAVVSRLTGPAPVAAHANLPDAAAAVSLIATANGVGDWANTLNVEVKTGGGSGTVVIVVSDDVDGVLETSSDMASQQDIINWGNFSKYVRFTLGASSQMPKVAAPVSLTGGLDDRANVATANYQTALDAIDSSFGPGQVSIPGVTTTTLQLMLLNHAEDHHRTALVDLPDVASEATLLSAVGALRGSQARWGGAFWPWVTIPGILRGTTRTVPPSSLIAGLVARNDATLSPDVAAAGVNGQSYAGLSVSQAPMSDDNREDMNYAGINVVREMFGGVRNYGWRSLVDYEDDFNWVGLGSARLVMGIWADSNAILERFVFSQIDGQGTLLASLNGELTAMLAGYFSRGSLYGTTPNEAFNVETGPQVNTPETIANQEIHAVISLKVSPMAELIVLEIVKVAITDSVA